MKPFKFLPLLFILALLFGGMSGVLGAGSTIQGMRVAFREAPGSFIMGGVEQGVKTYLMAWPQAGRYGFVFVSETGASVDVNGLRIGSVTASELVAILQTRGWSYIQAATLPEALKRVLGTPSLLSALMSMKGTLPTIIMLPAIIVPTMPVPDTQS